MNGDMPDIEMVTSDAETGVDETALKALLLRRFAHDITACDETNQLLAALGLTLGSPEGQEIDHQASHARMHQVHPMEATLKLYAEIMGVVVSTAMTEGAGCTQTMGDASIAFAEQNAEVVLASSRAIIAQLMFMGVLQYGPASVLLQQNEV